MLLRTKMWEGLTADHFKNMLIALGKKSLLNSSDSQSKNACAALTPPPPPLPLTLVTSRVCLLFPLKTGDSSSSSFVQLKLAIRKSCNY